MRNNKKILKSGIAYRKIRKMIMLHRFESGFRLNVESLSREMGLSRGPVWEAIRRLEQEGIVYTIPNRGVFLAEISLDYMLDLIEVRAVLDIFACRLACKNITQRSINLLENCLLEQLYAIEQGDYSKYMAADQTFHRLIYQASGNSYLALLYESIILQMLPIPRSKDLLISPSSHTGKSIYETHHEIVDGLKSHNVKQTEKAMASHTDIIINDLKDKIKAEAKRKRIVKSLVKNTASSKSRKKDSVRSKTIYKAASAKE
jgi:DNA-binding GntR family transcriptional regulator